MKRDPGFSPKRDPPFREINPLLQWRSEGGGDDLIGSVDHRSSPTRSRQIDPPHLPRTPSLPQGGASSVTESRTAPLSAQAHRECSVGAVPPAHPTDDHGRASDRQSHSQRDPGTGVRGLSRRVLSDVGAPAADAARSARHGAVRNGSGGTMSIRLVAVHDLARGRPHACRRVQHHLGL